MTASTRRAIYVVFNLLAALCIITLAAMGPAASPRVLYLILLLAICTSPLLFMRELNGRFALLAVFYAVYLIFYAVPDIDILLGGAPMLAESGLLSDAEFGVLLGALLVLAGYLAVSGSTPAPQVSQARDWAPSAIVILGFAFWSIGTATTWYWQVHVLANALTMNKGIGNFPLLLLTAGRMLQPLGIIMLAYAMFITRSRWLLGLVIVMLAAQILVGFIGDSKETALRGLIIVIMAAFLLTGRPPKGWLAAAVVFAALVFPVFQAYRSEVMGVRGMSRAGAASDIVHSIQLAWSAREKVAHGYREEYRAQSFVQRAALKPNLALLIAKTGDVAPFQNGHTLSLFFTAFVPRYWWNDKPDTSVGQLMNREFKVSEDRDTYISATHIGELYWNFGWPGIVVGMFALGALLGFINRRCDLSQQRSLTRLLILVTTIYACIVRFEASIALEYVVFVRSLFIIGVLHLIFARRAGSSQPAFAVREPADVYRIPAPQLMR
jgi:hypothetical protein